MPRQYLMNWDGAPNFRWRKMYKGKNYAVTCQELKAVTWTKEGSGKLADAWWRARLVELEGVKGRVNLLKEFLDPEADKLKRQAEEERRQRERRQEEAFEAVMERVADLPPEELDRALALSPELDLLKPDEQAATTKDRTIKFHADRFLAVLQGQAKPLTFREIRDYIKNLAVHLGENTDVGVLNEEKVEGVYLRLKNADLGQDTKKKRWGFFRRFVEYLASKKEVEMPRNLYSRMFRFRVETRAVKKYDLAEVRRVLGGLTPRFRLYALLGLNCGMTSADIGQLTKDMIRGGVLTRRRVKTGPNPNVPTVSYKLWPETLALLEECKSDHPTLVLTGRTGQALWESRQESDGRTPQKDMIYQQWKRAKVAIPHKAFRSISATALESHKDWGRFSAYFLGHSPKTVKDKHYAAPSDELFAEVMDWLRGYVLGSPGAARPEAVPQTVAM